MARAESAAGAAAARGAAADTGTGTGTGTSTSAAARFAPQPGDGRAIGRRSRGDRLPVRRNDARARRHAGWWAFAIHRVSGLLLSVFLPLHLLLLSQSLRGTDAFGAALAWVEQPLFRIGIWGLSILLAAHLIGGLRLLWIEFRPWQGPRKGLIGVMIGVSVLFGLVLAVTILR